MKKYLMENLHKRINPISILIETMTNLDKGIANVLNSDPAIHELYNMDRIETLRQALGIERLRGETKTHAMDVMTLAVTKYLGFYKDVVVGYNESLSELMSDINTVAIISGDYGDKISSIKADPVYTDRLKSVFTHVISDIVLKNSSQSEDSMDPEANVSKLLGLCTDKVNSLKSVKEVVDAKNKLGVVLNNLFKSIGDDNSQDDVYAILNMVTNRLRDLALYKVNEVTSVSIGSTDSVTLTELNKSLNTINSTIINVTSIISKIDVAFKFDAHSLLVDKINSEITKLTAGLKNEDIEKVQKYHLLLDLLLTVKKTEMRVLTDVKTDINSAIELNDSINDVISGVINKSHV